MRGLLIVVVGAGLLWLVLSKLRPVDAAVPDEDGSVAALEEREPRDEERGVMLERPVPKVEEELPIPQETPVAEVPAPEPEPEKSDPEPERSQEPALGEWTSEDELALASRLVHAPADVPAWIQRNGKGLSEGRRRLVLALAAAAVGDRGRAKSYADGLEDARDVLSDERAVLRSALEASPAQGARAIPASVSRESFVAQAASMALLARKAQADLDAGESKAAARAYSTLLLEELSAPWAEETATLAQWSANLHQAQEGWRWNRHAEWPSIDVVARSGDSMTRIRKRVIDEHPDVLVCTGLIERANELVGKVFHPDDVIRVPTDRASTLVDLSARWLLYLLGDEVVAAWQVGIGREGHETRPGEYYVGEKETEPMWFRPGEAPVPFGDPLNPLGTRWIAWFSPDGKKTSLGFHGTNEPQSMGKMVSEGCVRMRNHEVETLFEILPRDSTVVVRP